MKLKEIHRTATFAWDNASSSSPLIATGAVAGALDESFSNDSQLEIWQPDFTDGQGMRLGSEGKGAKGSITISSRLVIARHGDIFRIFGFKLIFVSSSSALIA